MRLNGGMSTPPGINDQIELLRQDGLVVDDEQEHSAQRFLLNHGFFRTTEYLKYFASPTPWEKLENIADTDQELRDTLLWGLSRLEVAFRSRFAYFFTGHESATSYLEEKKYQEPHIGGRRGSTLTPEGVVDALHSDIERSKEAFAKDHSFRHPIPLDHAVELLSMGTLSKAYDGVKNTTIKNAVAHSFGFEDSLFFGAVFRSLTDLRNNCAHHVRLWHKRPRFAPPLKRELHDDSDASIYDHTPWAWIVGLWDVVDQVENSTDFSTRVQAVIAETPEFQEGLTHPKG